MAFTHSVAILSLVCIFGCIPSLALDNFRRSINFRRNLLVAAPATCPLGNGTCPPGCPGNQGSDSGGCSASVSLKRGPSTINSTDGVTSDWGSLSAYKVSDLYNGFDTNCNKDANGDLYMASVGACSGGALRICFVYRAKAAYTFTKSTNDEWVALNCDQSNKFFLLGKSYLADNSGYEACFSVSATATAKLVSFLVHGEITGTTSATPAKCCPVVFNIVCPTNLCANVSCPATACSTGACDSSTGNCVYTNKPDGGTCNDGNACTQTDTCQSGICQGGNPLVCSALDQCHIPGTCNTTTGACSNPVKTSGQSCDDQNACTRTDTCQAGICVGSNPVVCTASDQCHVPGTCNSTTGACTNPVKANNLACNDGDACTQTDTCQAGICTGSNPVVCTALDQCHVPGTCNSTSGTCSNPAAADGFTCNDQNACTQTDTCQNGNCTGSDPVVCTALDQCHVPGTCNTATGNCTNPTQIDGFTCNDGNECTQTDTCQSGSCQGSDPVVCLALDQCHVPGTCNTSTGNCSNPAQIDGFSCNDGDECTQTDTCQAGVCEGTNPVVCTALDQCHVPGTCNSSSGNCSNPAQMDGFTCNDSNACTQTDTCQAGICEGSNPVVCTALDQCHVPGTCNSTSGNCSNPAQTDGFSCNDGDECTQTDTCQAGNCEGFNPVVCTALDQCHVPGACNSASGNCSNPAQIDGFTCNDSNACTQTDTCQAGICEGSNPVVCTALDQCHVPGTCNTATGNCTNPVQTDGYTCNDSNECTQTDTCQAGICEGSNPVVCTALDQCHIPGTCNTGTGNCSNPAQVDGYTCNDSNACTQTDTCQAGSCQGSNPVVCTALDQCHVPGLCNTATGNCTNPVQVDDYTCNDSNACTRTDTCQAGICEGSNPVVCTALDQCHIPGTCNIATGNCSNPAQVDGYTCNDGNACTRTDTCQVGSCQGSDPVVCTALDQCHVPGMCNTTTGACSNPARSDGYACNDGNTCTQTDTCQAGSCQGSNPVVCTAIDQCHVPGMCNTTTGTCSNPARSNGYACNDGNACTRADTCQAGICSGSNPVLCTASDQCHLAGTCNTTTGTCSNPVQINGFSCTGTGSCGAGCFSGSCMNAKCDTAFWLPSIADCQSITGSCSTTSKCCNWAQLGHNNWGFVKFVAPSPATTFLQGPLVAGAAQNNPSKGTIIGSFFYRFNGIRVEWYMASSASRNVIFKDIQIWANFGEKPSKNPGGWTTVLSSVSAQNSYGNAVSPKVTAVAGANSNQGMWLSAHASVGWF